MELLKINDPVLREIPAEFDFETQNAQELVDALWAKCRELRGLGLSANQVGINAKVFVMGTDETNRKNIFNPTVVALSDKTSMATEGCLSLPGMWVNIRRPEEVTISYRNVEGEYVVEQLVGLEARIALHEYDHMVGLNFLDRASKLKRDMAIKSLEKRAKRYIQKYVRQNV
jgi:peptide deformylase